MDHVGCPPRFGGQASSTARVVNRLENSENLRFSEKWARNEPFKMGITKRDVMGHL